MTTLDRAGNLASAMTNRGTEDRGGPGPDDDIARKRIDQIIASLQGADDLGDAYATVDEWSRAGRARDLLELAAAIERGCDVEGNEVVPFEALADRVEEVLASTSATADASDHVDALLGALERRRVRSGRSPRLSWFRVRSLASRLGHGQTSDVLLAALARNADGGERDELLACWMHETVLRGTALEREGLARGFQARLAARRHVLGCLPLSLLEVEIEAPACMPLFGPSTIRTSVPAIERSRTFAGAVIPLVEHGVQRVTRVADSALEQRIAEAVAPWTIGSNGKVEAKVFALEAALGPVAPGEWLVRALPLECSRGAADLHVEVVGVAAVWGALFSAAANGGAYSPGLGGAYGRHAAWRSLGALVDASPGDTPSEIERRARPCAFLKFGASGGWFHDIAWDLGILAVRAGGASVAVLAATDTD